MFAIRLPTLRERKEDILPLCDVLLRQIAASFSRPPAGIARDAEAVLVAYDWPGNVRELRNVLERAAILCEGGLITAEHVSFASLDPAPAVVASAVSPAPAARREPTTLRGIEKATIEQALLEARYNKTLAAERLGLSRKQLYVRMRQHGL